MGYDLHITRAEDWGDSSSSPIEWEEWADFVEHDPELSFSTEDRVRFSEKEEKPPLVDWHGLEIQKGCLHLFEGRVVAKNPDDALVGKMIEIAERLNATVQGDDGESYPSSDVSRLNSRSGCMGATVGLFAAGALVAAALQLR